MRKKRIPDVLLASSPLPVFRPFLFHRLCILVHPSRVPRDRLRHLRICALFALLKRVLHRCSGSFQPDVITFWVLRICFDLLLRSASLAKRCRERTGEPFQSAYVCARGRDKGKVHGLEMPRALLLVLSRCSLYGQRKPRLQHILRPVTTSLLLCFVPLLLFSWQREVTSGTSLLLFFFFTSTIITPSPQRNYSPMCLFYRTKNINTKQIGTLRNEEKADSRH